MSDSKAYFVLTSEENDLDSVNPKLDKTLLKMWQASELALNNVLINIGILPNRCGYNYLKQAVLNVLFITQECTYKLYNKIAKAFKCSPQSVERAIRHSVNQAYNCGKLKAINKLFSANIVDNYHLTNTEIIALLAQYIAEKKPWQD